MRCEECSQPADRPASLGAMGLADCGGRFLGDPLNCPSCGARMRIVAFITEPVVIARILDHLDLRSPARAPPESTPSCRSLPRWTSASWSSSRADNPPLSFFSPLDPPSPTSLISGPALRGENFGRSPGPAELRFPISRPRQPSENQALSLCPTISSSPP